ncbi:MAG: cation:proton antiporter, partial [Lapillicoccus sp.]
VGVLAVPAGLLLAHLFGTGHGALYAVLLASSSAALVLPAVGATGLSGRPLTDLLPQVAVADAACIVALPLAIDPAHVGRALVGVLVVAAFSWVLFLVLRTAERRGLRRRMHKISGRYDLALELRVSLALLFALAALAAAFHVSVLLAGFGFGLVVAGIGEPRRLARQLFGLTEGFLGPLFFVWLGSSLDLRALATHSSAIWLGLALGAAALVLHGLVALDGVPVPIAVLAGAQLGVPVAAVTLGQQLGLLAPGEGTALLLGALVTIGAAAVAAGAMGRRYPSKPVAVLP